jgi:hypothetical protein
MDAEIIQKAVQVIVPAIIGIPSVYFAARQFSLGNKNSYREEYRFAKELFEDIAENPSMHKFARYKGYQALLGSQSLPSEVIEYLMRASNPARSISDYRVSRSYLTHNFDSGKLQLDFASGILFSTARRRNFFQTLYGVISVFAYIFAFTPAVLWIFDQLSPGLAKSLTVFTLPAGIGITIFFVREFIQLAIAKRLLTELKLPKLDENLRTNIDGSHD